MINYQCVDYWQKFIASDPNGTYLRSTEAVTQKVSGIPFLRGLRLSQLPSLGREPLTGPMAAPLSPRVRRLA